MRPLSESFAILRLRVEAQAALPALVVVSAAQRGDGVTSVACGLARSFAAEGHRTLLVDANLTNAAVADELGVCALPALAMGAIDLGARNGEVPRLALVAVSSDASRELDLPALLREVRQDFAVTIVDTGPLPTSSTALHLARCADAVILAVRLGRRASESDRSAATLAGDRLVGIVPTHSRGLRKSGAEITPQSVAPPLRPTLRATETVRR